MKRLILILFIFASCIYAQNAEWVYTQLPNGLPNSYHYKVGGTCIIFVDDTSQAVHTFDIYSGQWKTLLAPTQYDWLGVEADGNAALAWNDDVIVGYSALTGTFDAINYTGSLLTLSGVEAGCIDNFAFFVTDAALFVFDASDATWRSFGYTYTGGVASGGGVVGKEDYIYLNLWILNDPAITVVAYSGITKTFDQMATEYLGDFKLLDHGFVFMNYNTTPYMCAGYSAYNGVIKTKTSDEYITMWWASVDQNYVKPVTCCLFITREDLGGGSSKRFIWVYNTEIGDFAEETFIYDYVGNHYEPSIPGCGGSFAYETVANHDLGDIIECYLYDAKSNSFSHFNTPLIYWGHNSLDQGGSVLDGFDKNNFVFYDTETLNYRTAQTHWVDGVSPGINERKSANYWAAFVYKIFNTDTIKVMSYHAPTNNLNEWQIISNLNTGSYAGPDLFWFVLGDELHVYAPIYDKWIQYDLTNVNARGSHGNYIYLQNNSSNQCTIYDAELDREFIFPRPSSLTHRDSFYVQYTDGKYYAYSASKNDTTSFIANQYTYQFYGEYIGTFATSYYDLFVYDAFTNVFLPLTLTSTEGARSIYWPGGKTAFVLTQNGYLFAYKPGIISSVENENDVVLPKTIELSQNYPNPFNPETKVEFFLPEDDFVKLEVFNLLGEKIKTVIDGNLKKGDHEVIVGMKGESSGVYFYRLKSGSNSAVKKMILLR